MTKKAGNVVKELVKKPAPKTTFGTDPNDPWSAKANIAENITSRRASVLARFLKAKGYNPKYISKDQKDSHTKTAEFQKWKRDHGIYEEDEYSMKVEPEPIRSHTKDSPTQKRVRQLNRASHAGAIRAANPPSTGALRKEEQGTPMTGTPMEKKQSFSKIDMTEKKKHTVKEDNFSDPKAASEAPFDMGSCPNDVAPESRRKTKASSMVKEIYRKNRLKEDMYDWEKDQKDSPYGQKPKMQKADGVNDIGDDKPNARLILKGGTTLTGQKRDTVEIDPMMKNRSKLPDYSGQDPKKKKAQEQ